MIEINTVALLDEADIWAPLSHSVPPNPLTILEAHQLMQDHRVCRVDGCACKRCAWERLVDAGRIVPDTGRAR
ncbi:hypothetical protein [Nocardia callitridis]|uniref:CBS domain-containing protein n=1 Tax=Nocardia callitridis TaxID=648753 RepID=A0ABP9KW61_9NOCA